MENTLNATTAILILQWECCGLYYKHITIVSDAAIWNVTYHRKGAVKTMKLVSATLRVEIDTDNVIS